MADTLNFGPEWLRALSDGNSVGTPPPSPGIPGKYKLADYRYGREEMLALNNPNCTVPSEELKKLTAIYVEKAQEPLSLQSLTEEEQRLMSQSVNSTAVLRMFGRGGPPGVRGGRGGMERGRGRGRGRGEGGFLQRGMSAEEGGGFGRPPSHSRSDGWEEVGSKRNYQSRFDDSSTGPQRQFHRSLSNENWRDRSGDDEEEDGDWRKAGSKWNRGNWREPINRVDRGGFDSERHQPNGIQRGGFDRDKGRSYQRNRISESWDEEENLPEWSMADTEGNDVGSFDSSGAFVSNKIKPGEKGNDNNDAKNNSAEAVEKKNNNKNKTPDKQKEDTKQKVETKDKVKTPPPQVKKEEKQSESKKKNEHVINKKSETKEKTETSKPTKVNSEPVKQETRTEVKDSKENNSAQNKTIDCQNVKNEETKVSLKKEAAEAETLARLQEAAENVVLSAMTAEDEEKEKPRVSTALPLDHEDAQKWFYKDPQGEMQGPFTSNEMAEWFSAGYFTMNLQVKRGCDEKISPLGELIKSWGRVPFLPGPSPPPALNTPVSQANTEAAQQEQMKALQQLLVQQQLMQQQFLMRQLQMQQIQQVMQQLQENEQFKNLPPLQQQQLAMQYIVKQSPVPVMQQSQIQKLSPSRSPPTEPVLPSNPSHPAFHRSVSQPNTSTEEGASIWDTNTKNMGVWSQPTSVWDLDPKNVISNTDLEMQLEKARKEKEEQLERIRLEKEQEEKRLQEELKRKHEEMLKEQEELQRRREDMEREKIEIEKQRQLELQRLEEVRRRNQEEEHRKRREAEEEERRRKEEEMRKEQEMRQKQEELMRRKREEEMRRDEEMRQKQFIEQHQKQRELEERQKQEAQRRQEELRQQEIQRQRQQQEALKRLQQEQLANMQLPQHAQWASQQQATEQQKAKSLLEIQEQEERERQKQEEIHRQLEAQRQQMIAIQQQQQQQKSWSGQVFPNQSSSKSLIEIQEEQARQLDLDRQRKIQQQQTQAKNLSISAASAWSGVTASTHWASEGAWGNQARNIGNQNGSGSLGFWDDAIISSKRAPSAVNKNMQGNPTEFPALKGGNPMNTPSVPVSKTQKPSKMKKEEEAVQRLFKQPKPQENDFSQWCEKALKSLDTSVDIPTFVAFLTEVESPYEVHDYVRSYLGESKASKDFAKQFLEKRSQSRNKAKQPVVEESIWGPAPARDYRQQVTNQQSDFETQKNKGGKKKKKMMKLDSSILGFTVSADPERKNVGELDDDGK